METNSYFIKLSGKANIPSELIIGENYKIEADCSITEDRRNDNHDGTFDITYKAEPMTVEIKTSNGKTIKARDPRKNSQKIRNFLWKVWSQNGYVEDFESVYDESTFVIMSRAESIVADAIKRIQNRT
jgi:hypothetical protein